MRAPDHKRRFVTGLARACSPPLSGTGARGTSAAVLSLRDRRVVRTWGLSQDETFSQPPGGAPQPLFRDSLCFGTAGAAVRPAQRANSMRRLGCMLVGIGDFPQARGECLAHGDVLEPGCANDIHLSKPQ